MSAERVQMLADAGLTADEVRAYIATYWTPGCRVYDVKTGEPGTVTRVTSEYVAVDLDEGSSSTYGAGEIEWYTLPMSEECTRAIMQRARVAA